MKNWYKKPITKAIVILAALVTSVAAALALVVVLEFSGTMTPEDTFRTSGNTYEESESFEGLMNSATMEMLEQISLKKELETDGKYDPDRLVDVLEYYEDRTISGENKSGIAYTLEELAEWGRTYEYATESADYETGNVIVCEKPDGTYHYYFMSEFKSLLADGKLKLELDDEGNEQFLYDMENGYYTSGYQSGNLRLKDESGQTVYTDCWTFDGSLAERFAPDGATSILEVLNNNPELNGKLSKIYDWLQVTMSDIAYKVETYQAKGNEWTEGNTNFTYLFVNEDTKQVYTNNSALQNYEKVEKNLEALKGNPKNRYVIIKPKLKDFESNMEVTATEWKSMAELYDTLSSHYIVAAVVDTSYPIQDVFYINAQNYGRYAPELRAAGVILILSVILFLTALVWLTLTAGRKAEDEELHLISFDGWKTELSAASVIIPWLVVSWLVGINWNGLRYTTAYYGVESIYDASYVRSYYETLMITPADICVIVFYMAVTATLFLVGYMSLVRRIKARTLWKNSVLRILVNVAKKCCRFVETAWRNRKVTFRVAMMLGGFILLHWIVLLTGGFGIFLLLMLAAEAVAAYCLIKNAMAVDQIKKGIREIASGNVDYEIPLSGMSGANREMAEMVNDIGNGLQRAVEESMKSERLKTDLITNVSHDIKTPLTSIINYVDLLKRENFDDPKIQGYLDILEAKAQRLKTLTEDVVEASKVSSGNITLEYMDVNLVEMLNQTIGEFSEKMEARSLRVVATFPEEPAVIHVDGRRMWRVLENIFNNTAKYAMPGTRVYADLKINQGKVEFSLKNISENPLNINADELTERFIRGDVSRSTEGSGLGLSIAKSLTEMQGGKFNLYLDGDLFKVMIEFPRV